MDGPEQIRKHALAALENTHFVPAQAVRRIGSMVAGRPDWCISRQRAWGVPIALFVEKATGEVLRDPAVIERIVSVFTEEGADAWFTSPPARFLGNDRDPAAYEQVRDIVDVWFESGSTHAFVLEARGLPWPADLYLEGSDQHRGWFQSSLLEAIGSRGRAPFKAILSHGFTLDEQGRKQSKSLGNVTAPQKVIDEYGADILRLWVMNTDITQDQRIGKEILKQQGELYRRIRITLRWLLGCLDGFSDSEAVAPDDMPELERFILHRLWQLDLRVRTAVGGTQADGTVRPGSYDWTGVVPEIHNFCSADLSAFYFDIRKDILYCGRPDSTRRRACRTVLDLLHRSLCTWLAPILCFTAEEAWTARFGEETSVHLQTFPAIPQAWRNDALMARWARIRFHRSAIFEEAERARRQDGFGTTLPGSSLAMHLDMTLPYDTVLDQPGAEPIDWAEVAIMSSATVSRPPTGRSDYRVTQAPGAKCARCWRVLPEVGASAAHPSLCLRCEDAVESGLVCAPVAA
jgi:isoleucyl-tRNA synthetase